MTYPTVRPRRLRSTQAIRSTIAETRLHPACFVFACSSGAEYGVDFVDEDNGWLKFAG